MKKIYFFTFLFFINLICFAQLNLVPNPGFESYTACPTAFSQVNNATPWYGTNSSSELFNHCGTATANAPNTAYGFQAARTGSAYAGQYFMNGYGTNNREYIQSPLTSSLVAGNCYFVKFYVNCVNKIINYACNNFAAHLSVNSYTTSFQAATSYTPQIYLVNNPIIKDTLNWKEIGGIYNAVGGEKYITIGNFKNDINTDTLKTYNGTINAAYYYIDDVSVEAITTPVWQLNDTIINPGDSVLIGPLYSGLTCNWFDMAGNPIGSGSGIYVHPTSTSSYVLQQIVCNTSFYDTLTVFVEGPVSIKKHQENKSFKLFPNPASDILYLKYEGVTTPYGNIEIVNTLGEIVFRSEYNETLNLTDLKEGAYSLQFKNPHFTFIKRFIISR